MGALYHALKPGTDPERPTHIIFVGAGAVGCFYASRLHHPDHNIFVSLIARSNYRALAADGVKLRTHTFGDYTFRPHAVFPSPDAAAPASDSGSGSGPAPAEWDYIVVTTKALPDLSDDSALIAPLVGPNSCIVLVQNGVGVEEPYRRRFLKTPVISAVTVISAEQISPGTIRQNRWTRIHLGPYTDSASFSEPGSSLVTGTTGALTPTGSTPSSGPASVPAPSEAGDDGDSTLTQLATTLGENLADYWTRLGGIRDVTLSDEISLQIIRWHKLCINAAFNPSAVLSGGQGNADMVRDSELRYHLAGVMREIWDAAPKILGRGFPAELAGPEKILKSSERNIGSKPSMLLDWEAGRPMELEVILGNPVRIARRKGVELIRVQMLYALLRAAQEGREKKKKEGKL